MYAHNGGPPSPEAAMPARTRKPAAAALEVERVQTGVKIEKRLLKVLKALAEYHDMTLGDLLEGVVLHAFEGKAPFERATLVRIEQLKKIYGLDLDARHSHRLREREAS
jgi:hypothetical protein